MGNNPVNYVDPTGHARTKFQNDFIFGGLAHKFIQYNMLTKSGGMGVPEYGVSDPLTGGRLRADFYVPTTGELYEIKPASATSGLGNLSAKFQMQWYKFAIQAENAAHGGPTVTYGTSLKPDPFVLKDVAFGDYKVSLRTFTVADQPGLIFYEWILDTPQEIPDPTKMLDDIREWLNDLLDDLPPIPPPFFVPGSNGGGCGQGDSQECLAY